MQSVVTSWSNICHTLMEAEEDWWNHEAALSKVDGMDGADSSTVPRNNMDEQAKARRPTPAVLASLRQPMDDDDDSSVDDDFATADEDDPVIVHSGPQTTMHPPQDDDSVSLF
jgi:hypothetical protein